MKDNSRKLGLVDRVINQFFLHMACIWLLARRREFVKPGETLADTIAPYKGKAWQL